MFGLCFFSSFVSLLIKGMSLFIVGNSMAICSRKLDKADRGYGKRKLLGNVKGPVMLARHIDPGSNIQTVDSTGREKSWEEILQYTV